MLVLFRYTPKELHMPCICKLIFVQVSARQAVVETLERVFARHGAVTMDSNTIGFCPVDAPADTAELLSTTGARLAMRCCFHAFYIASPDVISH